MVGDGLLLDVVELVHALLSGHELADRRADHRVAYVVIATARTPLLRRDHLSRSAPERQRGRREGRRETT